MVTPVPISVTTDATKIRTTSDNGGGRRCWTRMGVGGGRLDDDAVAVRRAANQAELVRAKDLRRAGGAGLAAAATNVATVKVAIRADLTIDTNNGGRRSRCFGDAAVRRTVAIALGHAVVRGLGTIATGAKVELAGALVAATHVAAIKVTGWADAAIDHEGRLRKCYGGVVDGGGCIRAGITGRCNTGRRQEEKKRRRLEKLHHRNELHNLYVLSRLVGE
jgi:hypothetical protein